MSVPDVVAERDRISPAARATGLPLVGLTLGTDRSWSSRFWNWDGNTFNRTWCEKVRVTGRRFRVTYKDRLGGERRELLRRTIDTWGSRCQRDISGLHFGIVGVGSVGCVIAEALARMGVEKITIIDPDRIEAHNLDRLLYSSQEDIGRLKVDLVSQYTKRSATAARFEITSSSFPIQNDNAFAAALDCDILFSAVDRPLPKDLLNHIAYAHCIPVVSGGVFIDNKPNGTLGQAAWGVTIVGPLFRCLRCDGQYTSSDVVLDIDGSLDDPAYIRHMTEADQAPRNQNVFPFSTNLGTSMVIEMIRLVIADTWWPDRAGRQHYSMIPNRLDVENLKCNEHCSVKERSLREQICANRTSFCVVPPATTRKVPCAPIDSSIRPEGAGHRASRNAAACSDCRMAGYGAGTLTSDADGRPGDLDRHGPDDGRARRPRRSAGGAGRRQDGAYGDRRRRGRGSFTTAEPVYEIPE